MPFRDDSDASRARADQLEKRVDELEEELARAKGELAPEPPPPLAPPTPPEVPSAPASSAIGAFFAGFFVWCWFLVRFVFWLALGLVGLFLVLGAVSTFVDLGRYRPVPHIRVNLDSPPPSRELRGKNVDLALSTCLLDRLTYSGSLASESNATCYFPVVARAGDPVRVIVERSCVDVEEQFGPVLLARNQVPRHCRLGGEWERWSDRPAEVRLLLREGFRDARDPILLGPLASQAEPSIALGIFLAAMGIVLAVVGAVGLIGLVRDDRP